MHFEVAWVVASSGTQAQPKIILEPGYLPDYLSVSYDYGSNNLYKTALQKRCDKYEKRDFSYHHNVIVKIYNVINTMIIKFWQVIIRSHKGKRIRITVFFILEFLLKN